MRIAITLLSILLCTLTLKSQQVIHNGEDYTEAIFQFSQIEFTSVATPRGEAKIPKLKGTVRSLNYSFPQLLTSSKSFEIPNGAEVVIEVVDSEFSVIDNIQIAPSKGNIKRNFNPSDIPFVYGEIYQQNSFYPASIIETSQQYTFRDKQGICVKVHPLQYNPVTKKLRIYNSIRLKLKYSYPNGKSKQVKIHTSPEFEALYKNHFINYHQEKYNAISETPKLLIIAPSHYISALEPFILWKQQIGYKVKMTDFNTISPDTSLAEYIANSYHNENIGYVLLVGDHQQIPAFNTEYGYSDNYYAMIDGDDWYPEVFMGRFPADTLSQLQTMVERVIRYEKQPIVNSNWFSHAVGIASNQGSGDNDEYDWEHERNIAQKLTNYTYTQVSELYDGSHSGNDSDGDPNAIDFANILESGVSFVNYTGHGFETGIVTTTYSNTDIDMLNNTDKYPIFVSVGCVNGNFIGQTCFAEQWLRAEAEDGTPAGAINALMSTINQSWDPPMSTQDEIVNILTETYSGFFPKTFGCLANNGMMKMNDDYGTDGYEITATWINFGDPTTMVRTAVPSDLVVNHTASTNIGNTSIEFICPVQGATISITQNGLVIGTSIISGGNTTISFDSLSSFDTLEITGYAFNSKPYFGKIAVENINLGTNISSTIEHSLKIYPNPAISNLKIEFNKNPKSPSEVFLLNNLGHEEKHFLQTNTSTEISIKVDDISEGIYFLKIIYDEGIITKKIAVLR